MGREDPETIMGFDEYKEGRVDLLGVEVVKSINKS